VASTGTAKSVLMDADESFEVRTDRTALQRYIRRMRAIPVGACPIPRHPHRVRQAGGAGALALSAIYACDPPPIDEKHRCRWREPR